MHTFFLLSLTRQSYKSESSARQNSVVGGHWPWRKDYRFYPIFVGQQFYCCLLFVRASEASSEKSDEKHARNLERYGGSFSVGSSFDPFPDDELTQEERKIVLIRRF